jgi:hypothetical protein
LQGYIVKFKSEVGLKLAALIRNSADFKSNTSDLSMTFDDEDEFNDSVEHFVMNGIPIVQTIIPDKKDDLMVVEEIYFEKGDLVNSYSSITGEYEDFMMMVTEDGTVDDVIVVDDFYVGDTLTEDDIVLMPKDIDDGAIKHYPSEQVLKKVLKDAKKELTKDIGDDTKGYIYVCTREDNEFASGICISPDPLRKATQDDWTIIN